MFPTYQGSVENYDFHAIKKTCKLNSGRKQNTSIDEKFNTRVKNKSDFLSFYRTTCGHTTVTAQYERAEVVILIEVTGFTRENFGACTSVRGDKYARKYSNDGDDNNDRKPLIGMKTGIKRDRDTYTRNNV